MKATVLMAISFAVGTLAAADIPAEILAPQYNSPIWTPVKPEFVTYAKPRYTGAYFAGKSISAPESATAFRKTFELPDKTVQAALLQYVASSGKVTPKVNGKAFPVCGRAAFPAFCSVWTAVEPGQNELIFEVTDPKAQVTAELFVKFDDGTTLVVNTDESFECLNKEAWGKVVAATPVRPESEENAWQSYIPYRDLAHAAKRVLKVELPATAKAGETIQMRFSLEGDAPRHAFPATVVIRAKKDKRFIWSEKITVETEDVWLPSPGVWQVVKNYTIPLYLDSAEVTLELEAGEVTALDSSLCRGAIKLVRAECDPKFPEPVDAQVKRSANGPQFVMNGEPFFAMWGGTDEFRRFDKKMRFGDMPIQAIKFESDYPDYWWKGLGKYDFSTFDRLAEKARREHPDAYLVINLLVYPPSEWVQTYPDEMCLQSDGKRPALGRVAYSMCSDQALKDMREAMTAAINHIENSAYGNRVIAYKINSGDTTEWLAHRFAEGTSVDFSKPSQRKFKEYCAKHYPELKDTSVPTPAEREALDDGELLRQVDKHLKVVAYNNFYSECNVNFVIAMCREAKKLTKYKKLIGTYYGYSFMVASDCSSQLRAHGALKKLLDAQAVDFLMSPQCYSNRNFGDTCGDMKPFATLANHNILPIIEDDTRTHCGHGALPGAHYYCQSITPQQTVDILARNMAIAICRNEPLQFYALCAGYDCDFPEAAELGRKLRSIGDFAVKHQPQRNADAALVVSEQAFMSAPTIADAKHRHPVQLQQLYMPDGSILTNPQMRVDIWGESLDQNLTRFARAGITTDYLLAEDLCDAPGDYKVYFFLNCYNFDEKFLQAVEKLRTRKCTLVWLYAPGYSMNKTSGVSNMQKLTGFDFRKVADPVRPLILTKDGKAYASPIPAMKPMFTVKAAPGETVRGTYENGDAAYVVKASGKATEIFFGNFRIDIPIIQEVAREAGVFVYSETSDPVEANENFVTLHARFDGPKVLHLPHKADVVDLLNRKIVARNTDTIAFEAPLHSSWFFYYGDKADEILNAVNTGYLPQNK